MRSTPAPVEVHYAPVGAIDDALRSHMLSRLSADERTRHARLRFEVDGDEFLAAHALLREELSRCTDVAPDALRFDASDSGKPSLAWPTTSPRITFSLTHTRGLVACAIAREVDVGIDAESLDRHADLDRLESRVLSPLECSALGGLDADARRRRFFETWVLKEAHAKATGRGLARTLGTVEMTFAPSGIGIRFVAGQDDDPAGWSFELHSLASRHVLAVATRAAASRVTLTRVALSPS